LQLLLDRHRERTEHQELLAGIVASTIANYAGRTLKDGVSAAPSQFMPSKPRKPKRAQIDRERIAEGTRAFFEHMAEKQKGRGNG